MTTLTMTGLIFVCIPVSLVLIMLIYSLFKNVGSPADIIDTSSAVIINSGIPIGVFFIIVAVMFGCGLGLLAYVGYRERIRRSNGSTTRQ